MRIATLIAVAALATACNKKSDTPAPDPAKPGPQKIVAPARTPGPHLDCREMLPKETQDKYFAGWSLAASPAAKTSSGGKMLNCVFQKGVETQVVVVICEHVGAATTTSILDDLKAQAKDVKDVPGVGAKAYEGMQNGKHIFRFQDDDTPCYGTILSSATPAEVAKVLVTNLVPAVMN